MGRVPPVLKKANSGGRREARLRSTSGSLLTPMSEVQARVTIGKPFAVVKYAVTFDEWDACVADGGCKGYKPGDEGWGLGKHPVIYVNWDEAPRHARQTTAQSPRTREPALRPTPQHSQACRNPRPQRAGRGQARHGTQAPDRHHQDGCLSG